MSVVTRLLVIIVILFQSIAIGSQQSTYQQQQNAQGSAVVDSRNVIPPKTKDCSPEVAKWWDDMNAEAGQILDTSHTLVLAEQDLYHSVMSGQISNLKKLRQNIDFLHKRISAERVDMVELVKSGSKQNYSPPIDDKKLTVLYQPRPDYSEEARKNRVTGTVVVEAEFREDGTFGDLRVVKGLGYGLDENASEAVRKIIFVPAVQGGRFVVLKQRVRVSFQLL